MDYTLKIKDIQPVNHQESGKVFLDVTVDIFKGAELLVTRKLGFDPKIGRKELEAEMQKYLETFKGEQEQAVTQADQNAVDANVADLREGLVGTDVHHITKE